MNYHKLLIVVVLLIATINAFNISPKPNIVIKEPTTGRYLPKVRSSYFGYTLLLRSKSIFVGAPRAQSSIESQRAINETGLLYKCSLDSGSSGHCVAYLIDKNGNEYPEENEHTIDSKKKDYQWLGGSLDGGSKDTEPLIVCAPRMKAEVTNDYFMHGICYRTPNTIDEQPTQIKTISPLKGISQQIWNENFLYAFGEAGLSVHWSGEDDEILIGAPGINDWKGSVIRYRAEEDKGLGGLQKRDVENQLKLMGKNKKFVNAVPNPNLWNQAEFSYFGYSESSGYFNIGSDRKLLYVASAPRANNYDGEVYIYDIINDDYSKNYNIKKYRTFSGAQFGEFFGSAVLAGDINGDGHTDIIVSAPLYAKSNVYDCGAVYIYLNHGEHFIFDEEIIVSPSLDSGRFGTSVSLIGDINQDGYNDLAISAPFSENGKVYIYLGSKNGIQNKVSQVIAAPNAEHINVNHMFGYGLSKGLDIDGNGYNDFAIGSPNAEIVYLYKAYPIVKIFSTIDSASREIQQNQKKIQIKVCFKMMTNSENSKKTFNQDLKIKIEADVQLKRIQFQDGNYILNEILKLKSEINECRNYDGNINFNIGDIFKPIELKMSYDLVNRVPDTEEFCDKCAALDPSLVNNKVHKIAFSTGCSSEICVADLSLSSTGLSKTFVLGSSEVITVEYHIRNDGETAYLPQLNVTSSNDMPFAKLPSMCHSYNNFLICDLNHGQPMSNGATDTIKINFDASHINVKHLDIIGKVFSTGKEKNANDNSVIDKITMIEMSSVDVIRTNLNEMIALDEKSGFHEFVNKFEIKNYGPSLIREATISILIPRSYLIPKSTNRITVISSENITLTANYASHELDPIYNENGKILIRQSKHEKKNIVTVDELHANKYDHSKFGYDLEHQNNEFEEYNANENLLKRKRRNLVNSYTTNTESEINDLKLSHVKSEAKKSSTINHELTGSLPITKIIKFNCNDADETECVEIVLRVNNFRVSNERGVNIELKYSVDLDEINKILIDEKEFFFISNEFKLNRIGYENSESIEILKNTHYVIVSTHRPSSTPIWIIILSVLAGLILLGLLIFGLYKMGFFVRKKADELNTAERTAAAEPMIEQ